MMQTLLKTPAKKTFGIIICLLAFCHQTNAAPESNIIKKYGVKLFGTRTQGNGKGSAILQFGDSSQYIYYVGEFPVADVQLSSVGTNHAVLDIKGSKYILSFSSRENLSPYLDWASATSQKKSNSPPHSFQSYQELRASLTDFSLRRSTAIESQVALELTGAKDFESLAKLGLEQGDILFDPQGGDLTSLEDLLTLVLDYSPSFSFVIGVYRPAQNSRYILVAG